MSQDPMTIARTILAQIGSNSLACMGVARSCVIPSTIDKDENGHLGGVAFKFTNCPKVRNGTVRVTLAGNDTYNVQILNVRGREIFKASDIYADMLGGASGVIEGVTG